MLNRILLALVLLPHAAAGARAQGAAGKSPQMLRRSRQLVLVTTRDWDAVGGTLRRFERRGARGRWAQVGAEVPVVVGRAGLGWGVGFGVGFGAGGAAGPQKREGDGKAPAGVFRLGAAFGFAPEREAPRLRVPYLPLTPSVECVDDVSSNFYNAIIDRERLVSRVDWNSSERMREVEGYRRGLFVIYNSAQPVAGRGSCIFVHIWAAPGKGTAGCTALEQANLETLLGWLDRAKRPLLVQLPEAEYARLRRPWLLPQPAAVK
jgi:D-alanyl-D-alanine dipeptidase